VREVQEELKQEKKEQNRLRLEIESLKKEI
jgi:hypothetical protein